MPEEQRPMRAASAQERAGKMTVREAGHKGGQKVRELIEEAKQQESREVGRGRKAA